MALILRADVHRIRYEMTYISWDGIRNGHHSTVPEVSILIGVQATSTIGLVTRRVLSVVEAYRTSLESVPSVRGVYDIKPTVRIRLPCLNGSIRNGCPVHAEDASFHIHILTLALGRN